MSQIGPNPAKTANAQMDPRPALGWEVFVTPSIPIITPDRPPGVRETFFQAMASTLIYGAKDAVLVDAFMTVKQANDLADWVHLHYAWPWRPLVWNRHSLERFPNAKAVATPDTVKVM